MGRSWGRTRRLSQVSRPKSCIYLLLQLRPLRADRGRSLRPEGLLIVSEAVYLRVEEVHPCFRGRQRLGKPRIYSSGVASLSPHGLGRQIRDTALVAGTMRRSTALREVASRSGRPPAFQLLPRVLFLGTTTFRSKPVATAAAAGKPASAHWLRQRPPAAGSSLSSHGLTRPCPCLLFLLALRGCCCRAAGAGAAGGGRRRREA